MSAARPTLFVIRELTALAHQQRRGQQAARCLQHGHLPAGKVTKSSVTLLLVQDYAERRALRGELKALAKEERSRQQKAVGECLTRAQVVCATLTGCLSRDLDPLTFDLAVVDEAAQVTLSSADVCLHQGSLWLVGMSMAACGQPQSAAVVLAKSWSCALSATGPSLTAALLLALLLP